MTTTDEYVPGISGTLMERVTEVIENEVGVVDSRLAIERVGEVIESWRESARERAREVAQGMFAGLMPGSTGTNMANEVADKILAAIYTGTDRDDEALIENEEREWERTGRIRCSDCGTMVRTTTLETLPAHRCIERQRARRTTEK